MISFVLWFLVAKLVHFPLLILVCLWEQLSLEWLILLRIERRLYANSAFLAYGDRLILVISVFSSLPTYYMCTLILPIRQ
mgnify:CR=1 FL=1